MSLPYISLKDARLLARDASEVVVFPTYENELKCRVALRRLRTATGRTTDIRRADLELANKLWSKIQRYWPDRAEPEPAMHTDLFLVLPNGKEVRVDMQSCGVLELPASGTGESPDMALWAQQTAEHLGHPVRLSTNITATPTST